MNTFLNHLFLIFSTFLCQLVFAQKEKLSDYYLIQRQYEISLENDSTALPLVNKVITKAKKERNLRQLLKGYNDARLFTPNPSLKLKYADSAIAVASQLKDDKLLSSAYLSKGVIYYFNFRKYSLALNEYLKAFEKSKDNDDPYYTNKIHYHIGVVKSYIGNYEAALDEFEQARKFFECETKKEMHPNLMFGIQRGYFNTIHLMAVCYRNLQNYKKADSLVSLGLASSWKYRDFKQEYSYFLKEDGIRKFRKKDFKGAIQSLDRSLPEQIAVNDIAWATISYNYLGQSKWKLGNVDEGIRDYKKIDSIFVKHSFVLPEMREMYESLIDYCIEKGDSTKARYYMGQLLKVENILRQDFIYISKKVDREYDRKRQLQEFEKLRKSWNWLDFLLVSVIVVGVLILLYYILQPYQTKILSYLSSLLRLNPFRKKSEPDYEENSESSSTVRNTISEATTDDILKKLQEFEVNEEFLQKQIRLEDLAQKFGVNKKYLSEVIHEYKAENFHHYMYELRINYITDKLRNDREYLKYSSTTLAKECGISSRTNFSKLFKQINGINYDDFVKEVREQRYS